MATGFTSFFFFFFSTNTCCVHNCELLLLVQNLWRQKLHTMKCPEMKQVLWCFASSRNQPRWSIFSSLEKLLPSSFQDWRCHSLLFLLAVELHTILNSTYTYALICIWFLSVNLMSVRAIHVIHSSASDFSSFFFFSVSHIPWQSADLVSQWVSFSYFFLRCFLHLLSWLYSCPSLRL